MRKDTDNSVQMFYSVFTIGMGSLLMLRVNSKWEDGNIWYQLFLLAAYMFATFLFSLGVWNLTTIRPVKR